MQLLDGVPATVLPLHGELHPAEQARVLRPGNEGERRVILATSIAETSLTVPGVRVVVDCGFRRVPRFDAGAGLSRLDTVRISKAAARQRAGRAGREAPVWRIACGLPILSAPCPSMTGQKFWKPICLILCWPPPCGPIR